MAYNQASFFLFPPRYGPAIEYDHTARTVLGSSLAFVSAKMIDSAASKVLAGDLRFWFLKRSFIEKEQYSGCQVLFRGRFSTPLGMQEAIELSLPLDDNEEVDELYVRFLLTPETPSQILEWRELVVELGKHFEFKIMDKCNNLLRATDFISVLSENFNYCEFQRHHGWK